MLTALLHFVNIAFCTLHGGHERNKGVATNDPEDMAGLHGRVAYGRVTWQGYMAGLHGRITWQGTRDMTGDTAKLAPLSSVTPRHFQALYHTHRHSMDHSVIYKASQLYTGTALYTFTLTAPL
ncbi:hypothetical protein Pmani_016061 [Petrolisthes manimaculis]|uniref:Uncharacterized protein n=1 Tax=Petrolisthes manimaculis TaxID=1843537 RepID=A0AAE1U6R2_9EUCA|nr:hypothetical protein Pmani_016061 [Petrolisthes manimaculis]